MSEPQPIPRLLTYFSQSGKKSSQKNLNRNQKVHDQNL